MGEVITASQAKHFGLINWIVEEKELESSVNEFANKLCVNNSTSSMELTKRMIAEVQSMALDDALRYACKKNAEARNSEDCKKGIDAFLNKKKITW